MFHCFIDLSLHFGLCENESYSTFVANTGYFHSQKSIQEKANFLKIV